ncbi:hypothetical protein [Lacinutrix sp.]|uniref:hypothetical protein n=1 Tax=Lacinutrix sp. TaxID=1937692 RepID=UPI0030EC83A4
MKIIHLALCAGVISAYFFIDEFSSIKDVFNVSIETTEDYVFLLLPIAAFLIGNFIYKFIAKTIDKTASEEANFNSY